jgi:dipeptidyl aminopeptidase/acylaminoacyl peptidase
MPRPAAVLALLLPPLVAFAQAPLPRTAAEVSDYTQTTRHADVVAFGERLVAVAPTVRAVTYGTSGEGRPLPLLVLSDPPVGSPAEAAKLGRPVLLAFANIHAGEVDGKEALLALARDLATAKADLLKRCVILLAPDVNPDGNERMSPDNRRSQNGPPSVGTRGNAAGLDLNRDFVKLETPEIRALVKLVNAWDPLVVVDCHTTNGSRHRYTLTYDGPAYPAADPRLIEAGRKTLLPDVAGRVKAATGFDTFYYGNFSADRTAWETYPATPRFGVQYFAVRGRVGLLSESYSYAPFKDRVAASYAFVKAAFDHAAANLEAVTTLTAEAAKPRKRVALRAEPKAFERPVTVLGFDETERTEPKDYSLRFVGDLRPTLEVDVPAGYLIPPGFVAAGETLRRHGVPVEELREDVEVDAEAYTVTDLKRDPVAFQRHALVTLEVSRAKAVRRVPAGTLLVRTDGKLGTLAAYLLEPQAEDGLAAWNLFDDGLRPGGPYPVLRLPTLPAVSVGSPRPLPEERVTNRPFTVDFLLRQPAGRGPRGGDGAISWLPDGEHFLQTKGGTLRRVDARTGRSEPAFDPAKLATSMAAVEGLQRGPAGRGGGGQRTDPARTGTLVEARGDLWFAYYDGRPAKRLTKSPGGKEFVSFSPTGRHLAYVRGGNLFAVDIESAAERQLTTDGGGAVLNGRADWVYEEEIFNRDGKAYWWSPDGSSLAYLRFDDAPVKPFTIADPFPAGGRAETYPYPKPGDPNPLVRLAVVSVADGKRVDLDLGGYPAKDTLVARVGWRPDGKGVYAYVQNRVQTWLDLVVWDPETGEPTKLFRDSSKAWIEDPGEPHFLPDGSFLFPSERTGWKHLYHYAADGTLVRPVTAGEWEVKGVQRVDADAGYVYLSGTKDGPTGSNLYRAKLDGSAVERLTPGDGTHAVSLAPKGDLYVDRFTDDDTPTRTELRTLGGKPVRTLDANPTYEREEYRFGRHERVKVPMKDGFVLEGAIVYPPDFDPAKRYPVWVSTYAGPHAPTVRDAWGWRGFEQALAANGIVSFRVDPRSASGKGAVSAWACYRRLGVQELKDLEEAVGWIGRNPWADAKRVGISGHSYGGFMTAYALTHSTAFAAGIAGAPPTDWRLYDTIYTERYMGLPAENAKGYDESSCVKAAGSLHGRLLLVHGGMDDNVHMQNTLQFADALQRAGKPFELMVYPRSRHGIVSPHYTRLQIDFITRALRDAGPN